MSILGNSGETYIPSPADHREFWEMTRAITMPDDSTAPPDLSGLRALVQQLDGLAADAARNTVCQARGRAQRGEYRGLAVAYRNVAGWLRIEMMRMEAGS